MRNRCRPMGLSFVAGAVGRALTARVGPHPRLHPRPLIKALLFVTPLLVGLCVRITLDALANPGPGLGLTGWNIFGFALVAAMIGLLIYALRTKEVLVDAKPKLLPPLTPRQRISRPLMTACWSLAKLTGWTQRAACVYCTLLLERLWHDRRWRQTFTSWL